MAIDKSMTIEGNEGGGINLTHGSVLNMTAFGTVVQGNGSGEGEHRSLLYEPDTERENSCHREWALCEEHCLLAIHPRQEPYALIAHVRICAGVPGDRQHPYRDLSLFSRPLWVS